MRLHFAGDFCPTNRPEKLLAAGNQLLADKFGEYWNVADYRIANMECPITSCTEKIHKTGPHFKVDPRIAKGLRGVNIDAFSLANNHIMDYGKSGLIETCQILESLGIRYFGVGLGEEKSSARMIFRKQSVSVGILSYTCAEFSLAEDFGNYGALPLSIINIVEDIENLESETHHIVVLLHAGLDGFRIPPPNLIKLCRFLIRRGVSAVLCQHSHVCGAYEHYQGKFISYGQGSFVFDINKSDTSWNQGYIVSLHFTDVTMHVSIQGTIQFGRYENVSLMDEGQQSELLQQLAVCNHILATPHLYEEYLADMIERKRRKYYSLMLFPQNVVTRFLTRKFDCGKFLPASMKRIYLNLIRNEEHREFLEILLKTDLK